MCCTDMSHEGAWSIAKKYMYVFEKNVRLKVTIFKLKVNKKEWNLLKPLNYIETVKSWFTICQRRREGFEI